MTDDGKPTDQELRRLLAIGKSTAVRSNGFEFLRWVRDNTDLAVLAGDDNWQAIDAKRGEDVIARVFPKRAGLAKVRVGHAEEAGYEGATRNAKNEWEFDLDSPRFRLEALKRCLEDALKP